VQEYVGTPFEEYTVGVLHDMDGNLINSIAVRRLLSGQLNIRTRVANRTGRADLGEALVISSGISQGYVARFPEVTVQCERIAAALGARGAINIQCRLVDGKVKVFEINPRFSGTTSLRAMMGYNEPDVLIRRHVLGESIGKHFAYEEGLVLRGLHEYRIDSRTRITRWDENGAE
jgi:carbamoyl-phosphate synthase large subunit